MRAVIFARYSTGHQRVESTDDIHALLKDAQ
jgi:hypothetical protein